MYSVSMTTKLGLATVLGAIAVVILAHSKDQAPITNRCKGENCTITTIDEVMRKKVPKSAQAQMVLNKKEKSVQAIVVGSAEEWANETPARRLVKKSTQRLVKKPAQQWLAKKPAQQRLAKKPTQQRLAKKPTQQRLAKNLVENAPEFVENSPQPQHRPRREDDPFLWQESFN